MYDSMQLYIVQSILLPTLEDEMRWFLSNEQVIKHDAAFKFNTPFNPKNPKTRQSQYSNSKILQKS